MHQLPRAAAAVTVAVALSLGVSAGPVFAGEGPTPSSPAPSESAVAATSVPASAPDEPDLRLTVVLDRTSYGAGDPVVARATVANAGSATANGVRLADTGTLSAHSWDGFPGREFSLTPGQTAEGTAFAWIEDLGAGVVRLTVEVTSAEPDANPADNSVTVTAPITVVRGGFTGTAYGDVNRNHQPDPGEALAGLRVHAWGSPPGWSADAVTDSEGRFAFHDLLAGSWSVSASSSDWTFDVVPVTVDGIGEPDVVVRGAYDITGWLTGSARFSAPTYAAGDTARMTVTVVNRGRGPVPGLTANCWASNGAPVDRGELDPAGPGATIPAASSRDFEVSVPVDAEALTAGYLDGHCWIGPPDWYAMVQVVATARVPGARASKVVGDLVSPDFQCGCTVRFKAVPGVKVYLRDQVSAAIVARAVADANGLFAFSDLPADRYDLGLVGPWRGYYGDPPIFLVRGGDDGTGRPQLVVVRPGPDQLDPDPAPVVNRPPGDAAQPVSPAGTVRPATGDLAATGVGVGWLALGGSVTFTAGLAMVFGSRRRRT
ncbi:hypothetical protein [Amycolatopsis sp. NPDC049159]|uniref:hypothetical protein n=1 Tax=Amycolatopsis sp. NPDC049159 TaxID=3157210 RepID=UPI003409576A